MMNPEMMKMAMEQMGKMTPQQMADMQRQMASLPPGFVQQQMAALNSMPPEMLQQRMREASAAGPHGQAQHTSVFSPHEHQERLKEEGNQLFSAGKYMEAAAKYESAKSDLEGHTSSEAAALRLKCMLNLASCCLKLCQHDKCIQRCTEVLQSNPGERKALYRRGQSYSALKQYSAAVIDLQAAVQRSPEEEKGMIRQKLQEAQDGLKRDTGHDASAEEIGAERETESSNEWTDIQAAVPAPAPAAPQVPQDYVPAHSAAAASSSQTPAMSAQSMQQTLQMMCENPSMMEEMRNTLASMTPEQMQAAAKMTGMPEAPSFDPRAMRQAVDMMASMRPEPLQQMASMAASQSMISSQDAGAQQQQQQHTSSSQAQVANPAQAVQAMQFPVQANPEMMKQAVDIMGQIDPEQMASMMSSMGPGMPGGQADPSAMAGLLANPKSRELMRQMMSNIDPQQLAAMSKASGQALTPEQAETLSTQMKNMSDSQMDKLLSAMSWIQSAISGLQLVRRKIMENKLLALAMVTLLIAICLRWLGLL